jgi:putative redox protein
MITVTVKQIDKSASEGTIRNHTLLIDRPEAKGGSNKGPMGGELLLAALGGCFMSTILAAIAGRDAAISDVAVDVHGELTESPQRFSKIILTVSAQYEDRELMEKMVTLAERGCIVASTLRECINLEFVIR